MATFKITTCKSITPGGISAGYRVPDSISECVDKVGEARVLAAVIKQIIYHSAMSAFRGELCDAVEKQATDVGRPLPWKTEIVEPAVVDAAGVETKAAVTRINETEEGYIGRAVAEGIVDTAWLTAKLQELVEHPENEFSLFLKEPERKPRAPAKLPKEVEAFVTACIADGSSRKLAKTLSKALGREIPDNDAQALGKAVQEHKSNAAKAANAELLKLAGKS